MKQKKMRLKMAIANMIPPGMSMFGKATKYLMTKLTAQAMNTNAPTMNTPIERNPMAEIIW